MKRFRVLTMITPASVLRIGGVAKYAKENGWLLTIHDRLGGITPSTDYDGVLVTLRKNAQDLRYIRRMRRRGIPVVDLTIEHPEIRLPRAVSDQVGIGRLAGEHFKERGFKYVAWFSTGWSHVHELRCEGLSEATGLTPVRIVTADERESLRQFKALPKQTALLAYDEQDAVRALALCLSADIVIPDDLALLSIGDDPLFTSNQIVPLSNIQLNPVRGGYAAAALLDRLMKKEKNAPATVLIKPAGITIRRSTDTYADDDPIVRGALLYIRDNLSRSFGAEQITDALGVSRAKLDARCSARFGHSLGKEILARRLQTAKRLLSGSDLSVGEIARETGFCSPAYFILKFRNEYGQTPRKFRSSKNQTIKQFSA